ncbi:MAG: hypothetical protein ACR2FY_12800 [Pirellulaceae bacterium]
MTFHGTVHNGVVVLDGNPAIPDGTEVAVVVSPSAPPANPDRMTEETRRKLRAAMDEIIALPNENPGDNFSGADHDKALYGEP